ncbi:hypothetical protein DL764_009571 [Monosporascus ibericus]|uniref:Uncharacterized protein n=1 Tax=Monosporascus ibericus TaxID=155417 RepID=A0A4Q4SUM1_9PEZI|nr:hypothetical protein DL764_009571 [Monosporascus ibericus]
MAVGLTTIREAPVDLVFGKGWDGGRRGGGAPGAPGGAGGNCSGSISASQLQQPPTQLHPNPPIIPAPS